MARTIHYKKSPTAARFHNSKALVRGLMGSVGSGKTVTCINELHRLAQSQIPNDQGKRLTRTAIIRNTNPELRSTTLATFRQWLPEKPEGVSRITLNPMLKAIVEYPLEDGTTVVWEVMFLALDRPEDSRKLLSLEITNVFINEAKEIDEEILLAAKERIGRYPSEIDGYTREELAMVRKCIVMDTNPPSDLSWWYEMSEVTCPDGFEFFKSPPPLIKQADGSYTDNPLAENIEHLPGGYKYYHDLILGATQERINVMVLGNFGETRAGKLVYPEYSDKLHCGSNELGILEGVPIGIGLDGGLTPCAVFGQITPAGQLRVFAELSSVDMDVMMFARDVLVPFIARNFDPQDIAFCHFDPSGVAGKENQVNPVINMLNDHYIQGSNTAPPLMLPFTVEPAVTNSIDRRLAAVRAFLSKIVYGGQAGLQISRKCTMLRRGFQGGYCYRKLNIAHIKSYKEKPDKNGSSHSHDCLQYLALGFISQSAEPTSYKSNSKRTTNSSIGY